MEYSKCKINGIVEEFIEISILLNRIQLLIISRYNFSEHKMRFSIQMTLFRQTCYFIILNIVTVMWLYYSGLLETAVGKIIKFQRFVDDCRR